MNVRIKTLLLICFTITPLTTYAYVGPGMGGGIIAAIFGLIFAFILAILSVIYFPIKRLLTKRKNKGSRN